MPVLLDFTSWRTSSIVIWDLACLNVIDLDVPVYVPLSIITYAAMVLPVPPHNSSCVGRAVAPFITVATASLLLYHFTLLTSVLSLVPTGVDLF